MASAVIGPSVNCSSSSFGIFGSSRNAVFFLVGIHAPLTHVMPEHKISDTPADGFALTATHFSKRRKVSKRLCPDVRHLAKARCSLATVSIRGHRLRSTSRRPPLDVFDFVEQRYAPPPLMNTYARPAEGAKDQD